ncbi:MAG TPA: hypothetical protein VM936_16585 [Pyrinomonadaceae bacterium]|jgi:hypothetical protein|nr:hypothetical protein [Pyrinomonadaceae bacterium]
MQNFNSPQRPPQPGAYGAPTPPQAPAKKKMSTGVKVLIAVLVVAVLGGVLVVALSLGALYYFRSKAQDVAGRSSVAPRTGLSDSSSSPSSSSSDAEPPEPTAEQLAAVAGGQAAEWAQQEISWTVPQRWKQGDVSSTQLTWNSPGSWDAAHLIVSVSAMGGDFPTDASLKAYYDGFQRDKLNGKYDEVRWLKLDGVKGVMFRETSPESGDGIQRLQWIGYRTYKGQSQYLSVMLSTQGKYFARHEDEMYGILYSTEFSE